MREGRDGLLARIVDDVAHHGLEDRSLRELAQAIGTSHRMLHYHFGSRAGVVEAIVDEVEAQERAYVRELAAIVETPADLIRALWRHVTSPETLPFVSLFFEVVALASRGRAIDLTAPWLSDASPIAERLNATMDTDDAQVHVAVVRGLLVDVLTTGEVEPATRALERFVSHEVESADGRVEGCQS